MYGSEENKGEPYSGRRTVSKCYLQVQEYMMGKRGKKPLFEAAGEAVPLGKAIF